MIRIPFPEPQTGEWQAWRAECGREQQKVNEAARQKQPLGIKSDVYKGARHGIKKRYYVCVGGPFYGKCAYCEENIYRSQYGDIEHYRPKKAVKDIENKPVVVDVDGAKQEHPGYYWLAYDWHNLLPSCRLCNRQPKRTSDGRLVGKGNRFPVVGGHAFRPDEEGCEDPLLLNPLADDPEKHLDVQPNGVLVHRDERGEATISVLGLNDRDLPNARRQVYSDTRKRFGALCRALAIDAAGTEAHALGEEIKAAWDGKEEHSAAARKAIADAIRAEEEGLSKLGIAGPVE